MALVMCHHPHVDGAGDRIETRVRLVRLHKTWPTCSFQVLKESLMLILMSIS